MLFKYFSILALAEQNHFNNLARGSAKEHFGEIILKSGHWPRRRCRLNVCFFLFIFSSGGHFGQRSETVFSNFYVYRK